MVNIYFIFVMVFILKLPMNQFYAYIPMLHSASGGDTKEPRHTENTWIIEKAAINYPGASNAITVETEWIMFSLIQEKTALCLVEPYTCGACGIQFQFYNNLLEHMQSHAGEAGLSNRVLLGV